MTPTTQFRLRYYDLYPDRLDVNATNDERCNRPATLDDAHRHADTYILPGPKVGRGVVCYRILDDGTYSLVFSRVR